MNNTPFKSFGVQLKRLRIKAKESITEISGAVETDENLIKEIEAGKSQPSEELVLLLISHFALKEEDALNLWELAGYSQDKSGNSSIVGDINSNTQKAYITAGDVRILYTDMVHVKANNHGVVINFLQSLGPDNSSMAVSRIGMSHEHAKSLLKVLNDTINASNNKKTAKNKKPPKKEDK